MDKHSTQELLLSNGNLQTTDYVSKEAVVFSLILKWILKIAMLAAFIAWLTVVFMYPIKSFQTWLKNWNQAFADSFLGFTGGVFLIFNGPLIIIALLSIPYLTLCSREEELQKKGGAKRRGHGLGTFPIVVDGPFGVVSAAEFIGILVFLGYIAWVACIYAVQKISVIFTNPEYTIGDKCVSSSPLDGKNRISLLIKAAGDWTNGLNDNVETNNKIRASVEGPYGNRLPYHLMYEILVLVAGGIGISPFIAVLSDVIHRINQGKTCLPRNITLVWAVKKSDELSLLSTINTNSLVPLPFDVLHLEILIRDNLFMVSSRTRISVCENAISALVSAISALVSTGNKTWFGAYMISSTVGLVLLITLLNVFYITPFNITNWWHQGLLLLACMVGGVVIFGGAVVALWHIWEKRNLAKINGGQGNEHTVNEDSFLENLAGSTTVQYGSRPDFKEIFGSVSKLWGDVDVGVIVCGPPNLESSVAAECRSINMCRKSEDCGGVIEYVIFCWYN
ncbi:ferric reduction oxidase 7, chloroplastic [Jatropha curcas]|uniref:ferric reduction oxidase 7, chloroplastic n=1 Tax=Jatropha curcas TaxID=180498 RepID=UPI001894510A|nr:ferric reduction oxidase 7, chloroplastic [Jatropha curcas]